MRTAFTNTLVEIMREDPNVMTITADMGFSVFEQLQREFPNRFMNTGVTEQSSIGIASGLAMSGFVVYFYAQAAFATMRCFEQVRLDVGYNHANVKIVGTAAGFSLNQLGASHFAIEDVALMRTIPGMVVFTPGDPLEAKWVTRKSHEIQGPVYIRLTKTGSPIIHSPHTKFMFGKGELVSSGTDATLIVSGSLLSLAVKVSESLQNEGVNISVMSMHTVKPIDKELIVKLAKKTGRIFTLEEHTIIGGLGSAVAEVLAESNTKVEFRRFGVQDIFTHITGSTEFLLYYNGLSVESIKTGILELL